ncbi:hypothetical protein GCM10028806_33450 [Spirosoma terrae]|uniref:Uncharacterized protein n=1 Tax=Spirosoma terrae TaxID=1968276 RepID=A0A6L9L5J2_9BACT|nr:hypothetical protein [Spirosoma terrae]NDU95660.1 hypothetical protein [Spirosoma terrae]
MEKLPKTRKAYEQTLRQVAESAHGYVYEISYNSHVLGYEVFQKRTELAGSTTIHGKMVSWPDREVYPSSSDFGDWAWAPRSLERAMEILVSFTARVQTQKQEKDTIYPAPSPQPVPKPSVRDYPEMRFHVLGLFA